MGLVKEIPVVGKYLAMPDDLVKKVPKVGKYLSPDFEKGESPSGLLAGLKPAKIPKAPDPPPAPEKEPTLAMPDAEDVAASKRRRRAAASRTGRISTILSDSDSEKLGG